MGKQQGVREIDMSNPMLDQIINGAQIANPNYNPKKKLKKGAIPEPKTIYDKSVKSVGSSVWDGISNSSQELHYDNTDLGLTVPEYNNYTEYGADPGPYKTRDDLNKTRAKNQSALEQTGRSLTQMVANEALIGTALGLSNLVDFAANLPNTLKKGSNELFGTKYETESDDYTNSVSSFLQEKQDEVRSAFEIYKQNPNDSWQVKDFGWWADNAVSVASTLSMLIPAMAVTKGLGVVGKLAKLERVSMGIAKAAKAGNLTKGAYTLSKAINTGAEIGTAALLSRTMEGYLEARGVYKETYDKSISALENMSIDDKATLLKNNPEFVGKTNEEMAGQMSSLSADETFKNDYAMLLFDIVQFKALGSMWKGVANKTVNSNLRNTLKNEIASLVDDAAPIGKLGFIAKRSEAIKYALNNPMSSLGAIQLSEGVEEGYQGIQTEKGKEIAEKILDPNFNARTIDSYLTDGHIWEQAFWGALGGVAFQAAGTGFGNLSTIVKGKINKSKMTEQEYALSQITDEKIREQNINTYNSRTKKFAESMQFLNSSKNPYDYTLDPDTKQPIFKKDSKTNEDISKDDADMLKSKLTNDFVVNATLDATDRGNYELFKQYITDQNFNKFFEQSGLSNTPGDKSFTNMIVDKMDEAYEQYNGALFDVMNSIDVSNENVAKIVARNIARRKLEVEDLYRNSDELSSQIYSDENSLDYSNYEESERVKYVKERLEEIADKESEIQSALDNKTISPQAVAQISKDNDIRRNQLLSFASLNNMFGNPEAIERILSDNISNVNTKEFLAEFNRFLEDTNNDLFSEDPNKGTSLPKKSIQDIIKKKIELDDHVDYIQQTLPTTQANYQSEYDDIARNVDRLTVERYDKATDIVGEYIESQEDLNQAWDDIHSNNVPNNIKDQLDILKIGHHSTNRYYSQILSIFDQVNKDKIKAAEEARNVNIDDTISNDNIAESEILDINGVVAETDSREDIADDSSTGKVPETVAEDPVVPVIQSFNVEEDVADLDKAVALTEQQKAEDFILDNDSRAVGLASSITFNLFKTSRNLFDNLEGKDVNSNEFNNIVSIVAEELFIQGVSRGYTQQAAVDGIKLALNTIYRRLNAKGVKGADLFKELADQLATKHRVEVVESIVSKNDVANVEFKRKHALDALYQFGAREPGKAYGFVVMYNTHSPKYNEQKDDHWGGDVVSYNKQEAIDIINAHYDAQLNNLKDKDYIKPFSKVNDGSNKLVTIDQHTKTDKDGFTKITFTTNTTNKKGEPRQQSNKRYNSISELESEFNINWQYEELIPGINGFLRKSNIESTDLMNVVLDGKDGPIILKEILINPEGDTFIEIVVSSENISFQVNTNKNNISNSTTKLIPDTEFNQVIDAFIDSYVQNRGVYTLKGSKTVINVEDLFKELYTNEGISFEQAKHVFFNIADYIRVPNNAKYIFTNKTELNKNLKTPSIFFANLVNSKSVTEVVDTYMHVAAPSEKTKHKDYGKAVNEAIKGEPVVISYYEGEFGSSTNSISIKRNNIEIGYLGSVVPNKTNTGYSLKNQKVGFVYNLNNNNGIIESNLDKLFIPLINKENQQDVDLMDITYKRFVHKISTKNDNISNNINDQDVTNILNNTTIKSLLVNGELKYPTWINSNKEKAEYILDAINNVIFYDATAVTTPMVLESYSYWKSSTYQNYVNTHKIQQGLDKDKKITTKLVNVVSGKVLIDANNHDINTVGLTYEQNSIMIVDANGNVINETNNTSYSNVAGFAPGSMGMLITDNPSAPIIALFTEANKLSSNKDLANRTYNELTGLFSQFQNKAITFDQLATRLSNLFSGPGVKSNNLFSGYSVIKTADKIALNIQGRKGEYAVIIHKFEKGTNKEGSGITHIPNGVKTNSKSSVISNVKFNNDIAKEIVANLSFNKTFYSINNKNVDNEKSNNYISKQNGKLIINIGGKTDVYDSFGHFVLANNAFKTNQGKNAEGGYFDIVDKVKSLYINTAITSLPVEESQNPASNSTAADLIKTATMTKSISTSELLSKAGVSNDQVDVLTGTNEFKIELIPKETYFDSKATKAEAYYSKGKMFFTNKGATNIGKSPANLVRLLIHENLHAQFEKQGLFQQAGIVDDLMNTYYVMTGEVNQDITNPDAALIRKWINDNKFTPADYFSTLSVEQQKIWANRSEEERMRQFAEEWLVESLTQPAIIRYLNNTIYTGGDISVEGIDNNAKTIWQKIIDVLLKLFGRNSGNIKNNTILAQQYSILGAANKSIDQVITDNNTTIETTSIDEFENDNKKLNEESDVDDLDFAVTSLIENADDIKIDTYKDSLNINMNGIRVVTDMNMYINQFAEQDKPIIAKMIAANELKFRCQ